MASMDNLNINSIHQMKNGELKSWSPGMYVRKMSGIEIMYAKTVKYASDNTVQAIWLNSTVPILAEDVENALYLLAEKYSPLRLCIKQRLGSFWFKVMDVTAVEFGECVGDPIEVFHKMLASKYDVKNGPLWKVRLVVPKNYDEGGSPVLIFCVHHSITDAWTNTVYCREVIRTLNDIVSGNPSVTTESVPLSTRVGKNISVSTKSMVNFYGSVVTGKVRHAFRHEIPKKSFLFKHLLPPTNEAPATKVIFTELSEDETSMILRACKEKKITINSFMVALSNFALVDSVNEKKESKKKYHEVIVAQTVDMRRYYEIVDKESPGCHIGIIETRAKTPVEGLNDFWEHAHILHQNVKKSLDRKSAHKISNMMPSYATLFHVNKLLTNLNQKSLCDYHYCATNMGNLSKILGEESEQDAIKICNFLRATNREYGGILFNFTFQTFKNKMLISIDYYQNKISGEDINRYFTYFMKYIKIIARQTI